MAHVTGAGKTRAAIEAAQALKHLGKADKMLVITPASLRTNFAVEGVKRFTNEKATIIGGSGERGSGYSSIANPDPEATYHICSYELFRQHPDEILKSTGATTAILDEMHRTKDVTTDTFRQLNKIRPQLKNIIGLTGSLISTHPNNILQPVRLVAGKSPWSKEQFEEQYIHRAPVESKKPKGLFSFLMNPPKKASGWFSFFGGKSRSPKKGEIIGWQREGELKHELDKYVHYVGPEHVAGQMPKKTVETVRVEFSPLQEAVYRAALKEISPKVLRKVEYGGKMNEEEESEVFNRLISARKASNNVGLFTGMPISDAVKHTPKLQVMLDSVEDHLRKVPDAQIVIYSNLIDSGTSMILEGLKQRGLNAGVFIGKGRELEGGERETETLRQKDVQDFKEGKKKIIVLSGAGNEGISFPNATAFYSYDSTFNPERILQAEARAVRTQGQMHRAPENRNVEVRRFLSVYPHSKSWLNLPFVSYFKKQKAEDTVDTWVLDRAEKRHDVNRRLYDILAGRPQESHSLFSEQSPLRGESIPFKGASDDSVEESTENDQEDTGIVAAIAKLFQKEGKALLPTVGSNIAVKTDGELKSPFWSMAEMPGTKNPGDGEPIDAIVLSSTPKKVPSSVKVVGSVPGGWDPKVLAVAPGTPHEEVSKMVDSFDYVRKALAAPEKTKTSSMDSHIGLGGQEPQSSQEDPKPTRKTNAYRLDNDEVHPEEKEKPKEKPLENPPIILRQSDLLYVPDTEQHMHEALPWLNKEPGLKMGGVFYRSALDALEKNADQDIQGDELTIEVSIETPTEKAAFQQHSGTLTSIVRTGPIDDQLLGIRKHLRERFNGLEQSKGPQHVTLLYAHGLKDVSHSPVLDKMREHLSKRNLSITFHRLGTFNNSGKGVGR